MSKDSIRSQPNSHSSSYLIVVLLGIVLFNPFIIYLLIGKLFLTIILFFSLLFLLFILFKLKVKHSLLLVYSINLIAIISVLIHFEVVFRYRFPQYVIENLYTAKGRFYINKKNLVNNINDKEYSSIYKTNCQGIRIPESYNSIDSITKCDWLFIGDSYTQGAQVNFDQLYTSQLYRNFPDKVIVNYGVSGLGIPEEFELFKYLNPKLHPSKVFLQLCNFNDFMNVKFSKGGWQSKLMEVSDLYRFIYYNLVYKGPGELPIGRWTEPFSPNEKENIDNNIFYIPTSPVKEKDIEEFKKYLIDFRNEALKNNVELVILLIPTKEQVYFKFFQEVVKTYNIDVAKLDMNYPNRMTKRLTDSLGIKFIDLMDSYSFAEGQVFYDFDEHLNPLGHQVTAEVLTDSLHSWDIPSGAKLLSKDFYGERYGNPSQDKSIVVYQSVKDGNMEIFISDSNNLTQNRITVNEIDDLHPMLNKTNDKVLFTEGDYQLGKSDVYIQNITGDDKIEISNDLNEYGAIPVFSKSNKSIAYCSWYLKDQIITKPQIVIFNSETKEKLNITNNGFENWRPFFSPDESKLVYISKRENYYQLYLFDLVTQVETKLVNTSWDIWDPAFSDDGNKIIYSAKQKGNWDLFEFDLNSKAVKQITDTKGDEWDPFYISDSTLIFSGSFGPFRCIYKRNLDF